MATKLDHITLAHEVLIAVPKERLRVALCVAVVGVTAAAVADFGSVWLLMQQHFVDDTGNASASGFMVGTVAVMTLALYWLAGMEWQRGRGKVGMAFYLGAVALLLWALADWAEPWNAGFWDRFHHDSGNVLLGESSPPPWWFDLLLDIPLALVFSACGLLFIRLKSHLGYVLDQWHRQQEALTKIGQENAAAACEAQNAKLEEWVAHLEANRDSIARYLLRRALDNEATSVETRRAAMLRQADDVRTSDAVRDQLTADADHLARWMSALHKSDGDPAPSGNPKFNGKAKATMLGLLLLALPFVGTPPARAQSSAELCASAPVFQLLLDVSGSSPLVDQKYLTAVIPLIDERIKALPMCSTVLIVTVGDARAIPSMPRLKVLARKVPGKGATRDEIASGVNQLLLALPDEIRKNPDGRSELIAAFADAARNTNPQAKEGNQVIMLSDGVEDSNIADCNKRCRFPAPGFSLAGASVALYGVGLGLPGERAMTLTGNWERFFTQAGVRADLRRTF